MKRLSVLLLCVSCYLTAISQGVCNLHRYQDTVFANFKVTTNIKFGTATPYGVLALPQNLYLDLYEPANDTLTKRPLIVFQFGGGFTIGWRTEPVIPQFCEYFARCGYAVATIDYRIGLNPLDTASTTRAFYRGWQDERSAIRYLCQNAAQYKIDTAAIFLTGTSAGCFCALANGYMTEADRPQSSYGSLLEPADLGCIDCSGNSDFNKHIPHIKGIINQWGAITDTNFIEASDNVPVISFHGDQDILVPYEYGYPFQLPVFPKVYGSKPIHERLNNLGILNEFHPLVGYGHEPELLAPNLNDTIYNYSRQFLYKLLKPEDLLVTGPSTACTNTECIYQMPFRNGNKYCWQLSGKGQIIADDGNSITVVWSDTGYASVNVKELNYWDAEGDVQTLSVHIIGKVQAGFTVATNQLQAVFTNTTVNGTALLWHFGDGSSSIDENPVVNYATSGNYTVTLIANSVGCSDTFEQTIAVTLCPEAGFTHSESGLAVQLTNSSAFAGSYYWDFGDGTSSADSSPAKMYATGGTYTIKLIADNGLCVDSASVTVTIDSCPVAKFTYNISNNTNAFFYADTTNTQTYNWNFGDGDTAGVHVLNVFHQYRQSGVYTVTLKVENQLGCVAIDTATILIEMPTGIMNATTEPVVICNSGNDCRLQITNTHVRLQVFDLTGRMVEQADFTDSYTLQTAYYRPGIYFMRLEASGNIYVKKFIR